MHEYKVLYETDINAFCEKNHVRLASYRDISPEFHDFQNNILICSDFSPASGNLIHCLRFKKPLKKFGRVFFRNIQAISNENPSDLKEEAKEIEKMIKELKINLILCLNVWKSARFFQYIFNPNEITLKIPTIPIIAGTDANISMNVKY